MNERMGNEGRRVVVAVAVGGLRGLRRVEHALWGVVAKAGQWVVRMDLILIGMAWERCRAEQGWML